MRGQAAFEYLMMFSIVLAILVILTYYAQDMTERNREEIIASNAIIAINKIAEAADIVYTQGSQSRITLSVYVPENLDSIDFSDNMIIMRIKVGSGTSDIFTTSKAPFCCEPPCPNPSIQHCISKESGTKRIKIKSEGSYVNVTEG